LALAQLVGPLSKRRLFVRLPSATITFRFLVLFHVAVGILLTVLLLPVLSDCCKRMLRSPALLDLPGWGAVLGVALIFIGTLNHLKPWLYAHIGLCVIGALFVATAGSPPAASWNQCGARVFRFAVWCSRQQRLPPEHGGRAKSPGEMPIES